jgi:hypothetical protein
MTRVVALSEARQAAGSRSKGSGPRALSRWNALRASSSGIRTAHPNRRIARACHEEPSRHAEVYHEVGTGVESEEDPLAATTRLEDATLEETRVPFLAARSKSSRHKNSLHRPHS